MIGVDVIKVGRLKKIKVKDFAFWNRIFSKKEWLYSFAQPHPHETLAGIFAVKEAILKAGAIDTAEKFVCIEITHSKNGAPHAKVQGCKRSVQISISHTKEIAVAVALLI